MTDEDVVLFAASILDSKVTKKIRGGKYKDVYSTAIYSDKAIEWMKKLKPYMGQRRTHKIEESIGTWYLQRPKNPQGAGRKNPRYKCEGKDV